MTGLRTKEFSMSDTSTLPPSVERRKSQNHGNNEKPVHPTLERLGSAQHPRATRTLHARLNHRRDSAAPWLKVPGTTGTSGNTRL